MKITIYTHYNERRNQLTKATAELVTELPRIGQETNDGLYKVANITKVEPDVATWSDPKACEYDYYLVLETDNSGDPDFADNEDEYYVAVRKDAHHHPVCTILLNDSDTERQMIYWDDEDHFLHTDFDGGTAYDAPYETLDEAKDACWELWGRGSV